MGASSSAEGMPVVKLGPRDPPPKKLVKVTEDTLRYTEQRRDALQNKSVDVRGLWALEQDERTLSISVPVRLISQGIHSRPIERKAVEELKKSMESQRKLSTVFLSFLSFFCPLGQEDSVHVVCSPAQVSLDE